MKVLIINSVCGVGSTGRIVTDIATQYIHNGHQCYIAYGRGDVPNEYKSISVKIGNSLDGKIHGIKTRIFDVHGFCSQNATDKFLKWAEEYNPDLLWLHNIHGYFINIERLFNWIKERPNMKVKWTLHDCWAFTGHCSHFEYANCYKWKTMCAKCPQKSEYPASIVFDHSKQNYIRKKKAFTGVKNLEIIVPSNWLKKHVEESFLNEYTCNVVYNKIDLSKFYRKRSVFKENNNISNKKILLGVANVWDGSKGFNDFIKLSTMIDEEYIIVLVGVTEKQKKSLPKNIIGIEKTNNIEELVDIYNAASVFLNLSYEDTYPTVNLEAQACGVPIITYNTGGSVESVCPESIAKKGDLQEVIKKIMSGDYKCNTDLIKGVRG